MDQQNDIELIERYFGEELNPEEMSNFQRRYELDETFKYLVDQEEILIKGIRIDGMSDDLLFLKSIEKGYEKQKTLNFTPRWYYYAAAALALLVMVAYFLMPEKKTSAELFEAYFKPYPNLFQASVRGSEPSTALEGYAAYDQGDYERASVLLEEYYDQRPEAETLLLLGNSLLASGKVDEAAQRFILLEKDFEDWDIQARWFLGLCYLKQGKKEEAEKILGNLSQMEISYAEKSKEILKQIK